MHANSNTVHAVTAETFVCLPSYRSNIKLLLPVAQTNLRAEQPTASDPPRRPVNLITHDYRNADDRAAAERILSVDELAKQAALEDQKEHYLCLQRRFVEADQALMLALFKKQACASVDFLGFCRVFGSQLKGVGAEYAGWQTVGVKLFSQGEVTVSDLQQLFDDFDEDGNGLLTKEEFVKKI